MFHWHEGNVQSNPDNEFYAILVVACFFSFFTLTRWGTWIEQKVYYSAYPMSRHYLVAFAAVVLCILSAAHVITSSFNPFIYFRF